MGTSTRPLRIKFRLTKQFVKTLNQELTAEYFQYLPYQYFLEFFHKLSKAKIKGWIIVGSEIKMFECAEFSNKFNRTKKTS